MYLTNLFENLAYKVWLLLIRRKDIDHYICGRVDVSLIAISTPLFLAMVFAVKIWGNLG